MPDETTPTIQPATAKRRLARAFRHNGCVRLPGEARRQRDGDKYRKGYEVRLTAKNEKELAKLREALQVAGFRVARPFAKAKYWVPPVYGKDVVAWFTRFRREEKM